MNQLVLACSFGQANYRPWERGRHILTPRQVRCVMPALLQQLGTPARLPKPRGTSPGWRKGMPRRRPTRFEVIKNLSRCQKRAGNGPNAFETVVIRCPFRRLTGPSDKSL
jgi:hypothetical protein